MAERELETCRAPSFEGAAEVERTALELPAETPEEFEIVLGRRQIASVLFVATVILALFSAVSYLAGKSISPKKITPGMAAVPASAVLAMPAAVSPASSPASAIDGNIVPYVPPPAATPATKVAKTRARNANASTTSVAAAVLPEVSTEAPMFAEPVAGGMYLQMGAVGKGAAAIFAGGLRKQGFPSFVAAGPSESQYRVLIGPLWDTVTYNRTKDALDRMGVNTFGRTYEK